MEWLEEKSVSEILHWTGTYASTNILVTSSLDFPHTLVSRSSRTSAVMVLWGTSTPLQAAVQCCCLPLSLPESGMCVLFPLGCVQLQSNSCSDVQARHTCRVRCPPRKKPQTAHQGLHVRLYTWWLFTLHLTTNWLLRVAVVLGPSARFTFVDFTALFFREVKRPSTSSGSTVTIISHAKTRAAHLFVL